MGNSKKWLQTLVGKKRSTKTSPPVKGVNDGTASHEKPKKWNLWKSCRVIDKGSTINGDEEAEHAQIGVAETAGAAVIASTGDPSLTNDTAREEWAAICIQTAFRGFLARRTLRALKGLIRLQAAVGGHGAQKQAVGSLRCIQAFVRVQARIRARRMLKSREAQGVQQKFAVHKVEPQPSECEAGWCDSIGTVEDIQAKVQQRQVAAIKRERAMAYAFSNQWRANSRLNSEALFDYELDNSTWSWIWLDRWMSGRPGEKSVTNHNLKEGSETLSSESHNDVTGKTNILNKSASVHSKKTVSSKVSLDISKHNHKPLSRASSHGSLSLLQTADHLSDVSPMSTKKNASKLNGELARPQERQAFSNPKQRRNSQPNPVLRSTTLQKIRSISKTTKASMASVQNAAEGNEGTGGNHKAAI